MAHRKPEAAFTPAYWEGRLFKNSYTRGGQRLEVRGWSVKIQHQGRRRTFTFPAADKAMSARRALAIYRAIRRGRWEAPVLRVGSRPGTKQEMIDPAPMVPADARTGIDFWRARLTARKYPPPRTSTDAPVLSVNISHDRREIWFPLGTNDVEVAAAKALEIYLTVVGKGWPVAFRKFSREVSLAVHWTANPLAWTYTTFHTAPEANPAPPRPPKNARAVKAKLNVALIEPEEGLRRALAQWIDAEAGTLCVAAYADPREVLRDRIPPKQALWLVNRDLPGMTGPECLEKLSLTMPDCCGLAYSVYNDSEHLFAASAGGARAYLFKRTLPEQILQPLLGAGREQVLSMENIQQLVRQYFQEAVAMVLPDKTMRRLETLTQREHEILQALGKGYLDKEIADKLGISAWTVRGHVKKIFRKLEVHTRTEAVIQYLHR